MLEVNSPLIDAQSLSANLENDSLVLLDSSVEPVVPGFTSINNNEKFAVIPGARRFDYDQIVCKPNTFAIVTNVNNATITVENV